MTRSVDDFATKVWITEDVVAELLDCGFVDGEALGVDEVGAVEVEEDGSYRHLEVYQSERNDT